MDDASTGFTLADGFALSGGHLTALWLRYIGIGGRADADELAHRVSGLHPVDDDEHNLIAQAINELFLDSGTAGFPVAYAPSTIPHAELPDLGTDATGDPARRRGVPITAVPPAVPAPEPVDPLDPGVSTARFSATLARRRSMAAARRAFLLHAQAARLMQASGQLQFARSARQRAHQARSRASALSTE